MTTEDTSNVIELLTPLQQRAIDLILEGKTNGEIAKILTAERGSPCVKSTIGRWRRQKNFAHALRQERGERYAARRSRVDSLAEIALDVLAKGLTAHAEGVDELAVLERRKPFAVELLNRAGHTAADIATSEALTDDEVRSRARMIIGGPVTKESTG